MNKQLKILLLSFILIFFVLAMINYASATLGTFKQNDCVNVKTILSNVTLVNLSTLSYPNSSIAVSNIVMSQTGQTFTYEFCGANVTGTYIYDYFDNIGGSYVNDFIITPNGENASIGSAVFYIGLLAILIFFLGLAIYIFMENDNLLSKIGMFGLSYLLLIAITFVGWQMASDFLTSSPFLISMLRILFFVFVIGLFPLVIGGFAWYVIMLFRIKEIEGLMKHGMNEQEAEERYENRRKKR